MVRKTTFYERGVGNLGEMFEMVNGGGAGAKKARNSFDAEDGMYDPEQSLLGGPRIPRDLRRRKKFLSRRPFKPARQCINPVVLAAICLALLLVLLLAIGLWRGDISKGNLTGQIQDDRLLASNGTTKSPVEH